MDQYHSVIKPLTWYVEYTMICPQPTWLMIVEVKPITILPLGNLYAIIISKTYDQLGKVLINRYQAYGDKKIGHNCFW